MALGPIWDERLGQNVHRVAAEGISPEQAVDEAIARIKAILQEGRGAGAPGRPLPAAFCPRPLSSCPDASHKGRYGMEPRRGPEPNTALPI